MSNIKISSLLSFIFFSVLLFTCLPSLASEFPDSWSVRSTYPSIVPYETPRDILWKYSVQSGDGTTLLSARSIDDSLSSWSELFFNADGMLYQVVITHRVMGTDKHISRVFAPGAPAIIPDSPAPADWLNVSIDEQMARGLPRTLKSRAQYSERIAVSRTLRISQEKMSIDEAIEQGMLDPEFRGKLEGPLTLFLVMDQNRSPEKEVLRQLWAPDDFWWLYESNGPRKSLRLAN